MIRTLTVAICAAALLAAVLPSAASAGATITGSPGRDEVTVTGNQFQATITGAPTVTGSGCIPSGDDIVNRAVAVVCPSRGEWNIALSGGDDALDFELGSDENTVGSVVANGDSGADRLSVRWPHPRTLLGGEGDDVLTAPILSDDLGVTFNGGAGRDQVDYANAKGVNASIAGKGALVRTFEEPGTRFRNRERTDSFEGIERLSEARSQMF